MQKNPSRQPTVFVGHGSPMNIIADNDFTRELKTQGEMILGTYHPSKILVISAHWRTPGIQITQQDPPPLIYDFGGFPKALYEVKYPVPGSPELVDRITHLIPEAMGVTHWGIDHGTWSVLLHMFPSANIPVVQMSLEKKTSPQGHLDLASRLRPLRDEGVLILGSGNLVHSFQGISDPIDAPPHPLGVEFQSKIKKALVERDLHTLTHTKELGECARFAAPTSEHYLPLLYAVGASYEEEKGQFFCEIFQHGTISHLSYLVSPLA